MEGRSVSRVAIFVQMHEMRRAAAWSPAALAVWVLNPPKMCPRVPPLAAASAETERKPRSGILHAAIQFKSSDGASWSFRASSLSSIASSLCFSWPCVFSSLVFAPIGATTLYASRAPLSITAARSAHVHVTASDASPRIILHGSRRLLIYCVSADLFNAPIPDPYFLRVPAGPLSGA